MADQKISALPAASTPLAGTEVLPIVQSSTTKKVATDDLTVKNLRSNATSGILQIVGPGAAATRIMTVPDANFTVARTDAVNSFTGDQTLSTGNLVIGTSGKGIDFSANPNPAGMTSEILNDYEEGTFTPSDVSGAGLTFSNVIGLYTKVGRLVTCTVQFQYPVTADGSQARVSIPFAAINSNAAGGGIFYVNTPSPGLVNAQPNVTGAQSYFVLSNVPNGTAFINANASGIYFRGVFYYYV